MTALIIALLASTAAVCHTQPPDCSYGKLWDHLNITTSNSFVASVRPVKSWTTVTKVLIDTIVFGILKVDEKTQTVQGHIWNTMPSGDGAGPELKSWQEAGIRRMYDPWDNGKLKAFDARWENEFLKWDPADFCGISLVTVPRSMVWIPDINIREDASDTGNKYDSPYVNLFPDGWTYATFKQLITFTCQLNLSTFPFDDQICRLTFTSMNSDAQAIQLGTTNSGTQLTNASKHVIITQGEWELKNIKVESNLSSLGTNATVSDLIYWVTVSRRPMLYVINFIIPLFFFLILDLGSFFINEARGEKLGFKVTILLSISVLLLILKDMLPSTEAKLPWIANYCLVIFALVGISVLEAMAVSFLLSFEVQVKRDPPPSKSCKADRQLQITNSKEPLVPTVSGELNPEPSPPPETPSNNESELLRRLLRELTATREEMICSFSEVTRPRFRRVTQVIDTVFFLLYFITVVVFLGYMYTIWARSYFANLK